MSEKNNSAAGSMAELHRSMQEHGAYAALRLALWILEQAVTDGTDEVGAVEAESAIAVRRLLAKKGEEERKAVEVATAVRQLVSMGVLEPESTSKRFVLVGFKKGGRR